MDIGDVEATGRLLRERAEREWLRGDVIRWRGVPHRAGVSQPGTPRRQRGVSSTPSARRSSASASGTVTVHPCRRSSSAVSRTSARRPA